MQPFPAVVKMPLLVSIIWGINHSLVPPYQTSACDRLSSRPPVESYFVPHMKMIRNILCVISLVEVVVIVASYFHKSPFTSIILDALMPAGGLQSLRITTPFLLGCILNALGTLIRVHCYRKLGRAYTFELAIRSEQTLITDGAYGVVRHPAYAGGYMAAVGWFMAQFSSGCWAREYPGSAISLGATALWLGLLLPGLAGFFARIDAEEMMLKRKFGEEWGVWAKRVPYKLVPWVW
ncbi:hypothetical protein FB107DRAFT_212925 [Schizophyllum commune]